MPTVEFSLAVTATSGSTTLTKATLKGNLLCWCTANPPGVTYTARSSRRSPTRIQGHRPQRLEEQRQEYENQSGTEDPDEISVFELDEHEEIHAWMRAVTKWRGVIRAVRLYELARQLSGKDGYQIPA